MKQITSWVLGIIVVGAGLWFLFGGPSSPTTGTSHNEAPEGSSQIAPGTYRVDPERSEFAWAGKKPLIEGYVNSGTIAISGGTITVTDERRATGTFTLDMNTLRVGLTAKKPGQESTLEGHLKGDRFFDVAAHPTARFAITAIEPKTQSDSVFEYTVTGDLTLKGATHQISFPARIYMGTDGLLYAMAQTEIDRTRWGITIGSGNFFENLGDNLIDDMVALSFSVVAARQ